MSLQINKNNLEIKTSKWKQNAADSYQKVILVFETVVLFVLVSLSLFPTFTSVMELNFNVCNNRNGFGLRDRREKNGWFYQMKLQQQYVTSIHLNWQIKCRMWKIHDKNSCARDQEKQMQIDVCVWESKIFLVERILYTYINIAQTNITANMYLSFIKETQIVHNWLWTGIRRCCVKTGSKYKKTKLTKTQKHTPRTTRVERENTRTQRFNREEKHTHLFSWVSCYVCVCVLWVRKNPIKCQNTRPRKIGCPMKICAVGVSHYFSCVPVIKYQLSFSHFKTAFSDALLLACFTRAPPPRPGCCQAVCEAPRTWRSFAVMFYPNK